eukprot:8115779-Alexandrium_andersonii.AAC.1
MCIRDSFSVCHQRPGAEHHAASWQPEQPGARGRPPHGTGAAHLQPQAARRWAAGPLAACAERRV